MRIALPLCLLACTDPTVPVIDAIPGTADSATDPTLATDTDLPVDTDIQVDTDVPSPESVHSPCTADVDSITCPRTTHALEGFAGALRDVHVAVPEGPSPAAGWPVVLAFQGSFVPAQRFYFGQTADPFGGYHQAEMVHMLLDAGFAVVAPEAHLEGGLYWDTNIPPWSISWSGSPDDVLMNALFEAIDTDAIGPLDSSRLYATGISSGGYMTSRMAVSYPGRFRALAIQSASYATCSGPLCFVPQLPGDHPPTLFLHGENDLIVPLFTMVAYRDDLDAQGTETSTLQDGDAGHEWFAGGPDAITEWFLSH